MKISELFRRGKVSFSFEVFPPKKEADFAPIMTAVESIAALSPDFMSVTYGAGGTTAANTVEIASHIQNEWGVTALAHLTCVASDRALIAQKLGELSAHGIENVLALRGDRPVGRPELPAGEYQYACQLVEQVKAAGDFCVGAACYPEGHVEAACKDADLGYLKKKVEAGCDFLTTQMFFDNEALYSFLYRMLARGIDVPVVAGIMPVTSSRNIKRSCELSGATLPNRFRAIVDKFGDDPAAMKQAGIAYATEQIIDLIANGVKGIHVYTMNKPDVAAAIKANLSDILKG